MNDKTDATKSSAKKEMTRESEKAAKQEEEELPTCEEIVEDLDSIAEGYIFGKNQARAYALREVWYPGLKEVIADPEVPEDAQAEIMFLALSNALLDMLMDVVPKEMALTFARNLDDYLAVTLVNNEYGVDLLKSFQEEFTETMGSDFPTEDKLMAALQSFEEEWWETPRDELDNKSPNQALEDMAEKHDL
ncbi:MAG: hypothetical protein GX307_07740 [Euryarchaeota archaeon]|nr:hypothetical protein [Euryarchaeota archaeon]